MRQLFLPALLAAAAPAALAAEMRPVTVNGVGLEYAASGKGDPVLLIHGSILADAFAPLATEPALGKYRLIRYHRRGFAGSARAQGPVSIAQQAADASALLERLGVRRAHVVGHSYGAAIALQLALDAPGVVRSLALLEPPLLAAVPRGPAFMDAMGPIVQTYQQGDKAGAIDGFMIAVAGADYRARVGPAVGPGAFDQAVADADTLFQVEMPALQEWSVTKDTAGRIKGPVLTVIGTESAPVFREVNVLLKEWFPEAQELVVPNATHALQMMNPSAVAQGLARFYAGQRGRK